MKVFFIINFDYLHYFVVLENYIPSFKFKIYLRFPNLRVIKYSNNQFSESLFDQSTVKLLFFAKLHFFGLSFSLSHISMLPPRDVSITKSACPKTDYFDFSERNMCFWGLFVRPFASPRRLPPPSYRRSRVDTMPTPSVGYPRT